MRWNFRELRLAGVLLAAAATGLRSETDSETVLSGLKALGARQHPDVRAAVERRAGAAARVRGADGFFDPSATAGAGYADRNPALPLLSRGFGWTDDAAWIEAGLERAFRPGAQAGVGAAYRHRFDPDEDEDTRASLVGAQVRVPLRRDRGFRLWRADRDAAREELEAADADLLAVRQDIAREVELRYIDLQLAHAQRAVARAAAERAERLLADAVEMTRLGAIPAHQLNPARLEAARRREEESAAVRTVETARRRLVEILGADALPPGAGAEADLLAWARAAGGDGAAPRPPPDERGDYRAADAAFRAGEHRVLRADEERRADVTAHAVLAWRTGDGAAEDDADGADRAQWAVGLTWRAPVGDRAGRARAEEARARRDELDAARRGIERRAAAEWDVARAELASAAERLALIESAVETARAALAAEAERFQLGEGASRQVLDAQKDLTDAIRRRNDIAAELLRSRARLAHAGGRGLSPARPPEGPPTEP